MHTPSPYVLDNSKASLDIIDSGQYTLSSQLPRSCKVKEQVKEENDNNFRKKNLQLQKAERGPVAF